jgi:hypothetical protein
VSAQTTIAELRRQIEAARNRGESDESVIKTLVKLVPPDVLAATLAQEIREDRTQLTSAISKALEKPSTAGAVIGSAPGHQNLTHGAGRLSIPTAPPSPLRKAREAEESAHEAEVTKRRTKVRDDIERRYS